MHSCYEPVETLHIMSFSRTKRRMAGSRIESRPSKLSITSGRSSRCAIAANLNDRSKSGRVDGASATEMLDLGSILFQVKLNTIKIGIHSFSA